MGSQRSHQSEHFFVPIPSIKHLLEIYKSGVGSKVINLEPIRYHIVPVSFFS